MVGHRHGPTVLVPSTVERASRVNLPSSQSPVVCAIHTHCDATEPRPFPPMPIILSAHRAHVSSSEVLSLLERMQELSPGASLRMRGPHPGPWCFLGCRKVHRYI